MAETKTTGRVGASLKGKTILVVSVAEDLGYELATSLAKFGCRIVLAGRQSQIRTASSNIEALGLGTEVIKLLHRSLSLAICLIICRLQERFSSTFLLLKIRPARC